MPPTHPPVPSTVLTSPDSNQFDLSDLDTDHGTADLRQCPGCDERYPHGTPCPTCMTCDRCETTVPEVDTEQTVRGSTICDTCLSAFYWQCSQCDGWNRDGADCGNDCCDPDRCDCDNCRTDHAAAVDHPVRDYSYKPSPVFHGTGPLFLGPEIEIATPDRRHAECAEIAVAHLGGLGYLKEDSSIGRGFEIVTHPMSYEWAIANFPWEMLTDLAALGCAATPHTGIHVHLSRAGFTSPCHTYRWMKFIYRNETHVKAFARRSSDQWAAFNEHDRRSVKDYAKGARYGDRYRAINTNNLDTFELRIFASSLDPRQVQAVLAFAAASVEYTRDLTVPDIACRDGWQWSAFAAWLDDKPAYRPLRDQLEALPCAC